MKSKEEIIKKTKTTKNSTSSKKTNTKKTVQKKEENNKNVSKKVDTKQKVNKEEKLRLPITKLQKLKLKHKRLIAIALLLLIIFIGLFFIKINNKKIEEKEEEKKVEKREELTVYDINSDERPYAVMIPNDGQAKKRQYGIQDAYLVYEITVEGGITRLLALYKDVNVEKIGPTRSSRHYYLDYALENDAIYVHFGWSPQAQTDISTLGINNLNGIYNPSNMFWRDNQYDAPNNAFTSTENIKNAAKELDYRMTSTDYELLDYNKKIDLSKDETYKAANNVKIDYSGGSYVKYVYDKENEYYLRYNNENKHIDNNTNKQVHMKNIIVVKMDTISIAGDDKGRQNLNNIGNGTGYFITNGQSIEITWEKENRSSKTIYKDKSGKEIEVSDGNTFIQIQPTSKSLTIE